MESLLAHEWELSGVGLAGSLIFSAIYFLFMAWSWALILQSMAGSSIHKFFLTRAMRAWLLTIMSRYIPGNIWHIFARMAFADRLKVGKLQILSSSTLEQILAVLGAMLIGAASLPFWAKSAMPQQWYWFLILFPSVFVVGLIFLHPRIFGFFLKWAAKRFNRPELNWQFKYGTLIRFMIVYAVGAFIMGIAIVSLMAGLGEFKADDLLFIIGSSAIGWVSGYLAIITPSGLGVREGVLTALLAFVYPLPVAIVASLLFRIISMVGEFAAVLAFLILHRVFHLDGN
jgi:glycosyltransferase 2 family protein